MSDSRLINLREIQYLCAGVLVLAIANAIDLYFGKPFWGITKFIYLGYDDNASAWYSSMLFTIAAMASYECWTLSAKKVVQGSWGFFLFAGLLFFMSCDEIAGFHEYLGQNAAKILNYADMDFARHSAWVWIGGPLVALIFIAITFLLRKIVILVPSSMFYLSVGFVLIILGGVVLESTTNFLNHDDLKWLWDIEVIVEESLEMMGSLFIVYALIVWRDGFIKSCQ